MLRMRHGYAVLNTRSRQANPARCDHTGANKRETPVVHQDGCCGTIEPGATAARQERTLSEDLYTTTARGDSTRWTHKARHRPRGATDTLLRRQS